MNQLSRVTDAEPKILATLRQSFADRRDPRLSAHSDADHQTIKRYLLEPVPQFSSCDGMGSPDDYACCNDQNNANTNPLPANLDRLARGERMICVVAPTSCDIQAALLSPGNIRLIKVGSDAQAQWFPGAEELLVIDAMPGPNYASLVFDKAAVELLLIAPAGATFVAPSDQAPFLPNAQYQMKRDPNGNWEPFNSDTLQASVTRSQPEGPTELTQNNSTSYYFGLKGRSNRAINFRATVEAIGNVKATARSCDWEIRGLSVGDSLGGLINRYPTC